MRRLGNQDDGFGRRIVGQRLQCRQRHHAADFGGQIAAADADPVRDALAQCREPGHDRLQTGSGGCHATDPAALHDVEKAESLAAQIGRSAVRPHAQKSTFEGLLLQLDLGLQRDVVAEQEHIEVAVKRAPGFRRRVLTGHGDGRQVGIGHPAQRGIQRRRTHIGLFVLGRRRFGQHRAGRLERRGGGFLAVRLDGQDDVVRPRLAPLVGGHAGCLEDFQVRGCPHECGRLVNPFPGPDLAGDPHQDDRILI